MTESVRCRLPRSALSLLTSLLVLVVADTSSTAAQSVPRPPDARGTVLRHNPLFGVGPQTLWKGGFGFGLETEVSRREGPALGSEEEDLALHAHIDYGLTRDVTLRFALPVVQNKTERALVPGVGQVSRDATGVGDALLRAKWRFFHRFSGPTQYHAALVGAVKLPLASRGSEPPLGSGSTDFVGGATLSRDGLRYYLWVSALARVNGEAFNRKRGSQYRYDAAVGVRPYIPDWRTLDLLFLLEFNGVTAEKDVVDGAERAGSGGTVLALSPGFWLTYRNWAVKGGVKLPVLHDLGAQEPELDYTAVLEVETHMEF